MIRNQSMLLSQMSTYQCVLSSNGSSQVPVDRWIDTHSTPALIRGVEMFTAGVAVYILNGPLLPLNLCQFSLRNFQRWISVFWRHPQKWTAHQNYVGSSIGHGGPGSHQPLWVRRQVIAPASTSNTVWNIKVAITGESRLICLYYK